MAVITRKYTIKRLDRELHTYIRSLPEFVYMQGSNTFVLDHVDTTTELQFQAELAKRVSGLDIDTVNTNIGRFIDEIKTDQLFFTTETAVTKTNVGTAYVDIFTDFGGRPFFIDTTGFTAMAIQILWTKVGTGAQTIRIVEDSTDTQILESGSLVTGSNDFSNVAIPPNALNFKGKWRLQCKSTLASDDPSFAGFRLYLRR